MKVSDNSSTDHEPLTTNPRPPLRVGLTGGIASGKSAAAAEFARLGVPVIDADDIAHEVTAPGAPALAELAKLRPQDPLVVDGRLDRRRLRELMFADDSLRARVEAVLHPRIIALIRKRTQAVNAAYVVIVIPLLDETHLGDLVDRVLVVDLPESMQIERLMRRDSETATTARRMLAAQTSRAGRLALADDVIDNSGSLAELKAQVKAMHERYSQLARPRSGADPALTPGPSPGGRGD